MLCPSALYECIPLVDEMILERIHNHTLPGTSGSGSMKIYNRHKYVPQMRAALEKYATHIQSLVRRSGTAIEPRNKVRRYHATEVVKADA